MKIAVVIEAFLCFAPTAPFLLIGAIMVPMQIWALISEPLHAEGPVQLIALVLAGVIGLAALVVVVSKLLREIPIGRPIPVLAAVALGVTALASMGFKADGLLGLAAALPLLATAHILYLSWPLFMPLIRPSATPIRSSGVWFAVPMVLVGLALVVRPVINLSHDELTERRAAWLAEKPAGYSYHLHIDGWQARDLLYPRRIEVRGNQVQSAVFTFVRGPGNELVYPPPARSAWTMDTVFDELIKAEALGAHVRARFNEQWGYVERAEVEPPRVDSSWGLEARTFRFAAPRYRVRTQTMAPLMRTTRPYFAQCSSKAANGRRAASPSPSATFQ